MNKINVGSIQNIKKTLSSEKILGKNIKYAKDAGLKTIKMLLNDQDLIFLQNKNYKYELINDPIYNSVYLIYL